MNKKVISLSCLVEDVVSEFVHGMPGLKASFEIENNVLVIGDYQIWRADFKSLVENVVDLGIHAALPAVVFGKTEEERVCVLIDAGNQFAFCPKNTVLTIFLLKEMTPGVMSLKRIVVKYDVKTWKAAERQVCNVFYFSFN